MAKQKKLNKVSQKCAANGFEHNTCYQQAERPEIWNRRWFPDFQLSLIVAMAMLSLYLKTLHPSVPGGDSGELITSAHEAGVAHPPGYPLFTMAAKLVIELLPMSNVAWRVNLLNAVFSAMSSGLVMLAVMRLTGEWSAALLSVGLFSITRLTWQYSVISEVFSLNNMFVALLICLAVWFDTCRGSCKVQVARWGSFVCGLALCNQHTIVVYVACIALWVLYNLLYHQRLTVRVLVQLCGCFSLGLLPYVYLPLSAYLRPGRWTWGDQTTLAGFLKHLLREEYGTFSLAKSGMATGIPEFLRFYASHLMTEQAVIGPPLAIFGLTVAWKRFRRGEGVCLCVLAAMMSIYTLLFAWRSNLDMADPLYYGVVERFWMQSHMIVAILAAVAFNEIISYMSCMPKLSRFTNLSRPLLPCLLLVLQVHRNWSQCDQSGNQVVYEFGKTIMDSMPPHAIILTKGDLSSNVLRYLHLCENHRPDLQIFDQEILTYAWSLPMLRRNFYKLRFPGDIFYKEDGLVTKTGDISFTFKSLLDHNYDRYPIFACIQVQDYEDSWKESYELWNFGVCHKFVKKGTQLNPETWAKMTGNFAMHWAHLLDGFDPTSWEDVANAEMWNAKISTAGMLYDIASKLGYHADSAASYLLQSYKLYMRAMDNNPEYPSYWHKNFGLVCQLLVYAPNHNLDRVGLLDETVRRYNMYLEETTEQEDSSIPNIKYTINALTDYRASLLSGSQGR